MAFERALPLSAKIIGDRQLARLLSFAPEVYKRRFAKQLGKERDMFIGKGKKPGVFRRKLLRKKISGGRIGRFGGGQWSSQAAGLFKGWVSNPGDINALVLQMGVLFDIKKRIHTAMEFLQTGGSITSIKEMIVPIYQNLAKVGWRPKTGKSGMSLKAYARGPGVVVIRTGGVVKYYDRKLLAEGQVFNALMFIGVRRVDVKRQFDYFGDWRKREPKVIQRMQKAADKGTLDIAKGKRK